MYEWIGYLASALVAVSITIKGGFYFRVLNLAGSICFLIYGVIIGSIPVIIINTYGIGINIFHLIKLKLNIVKKTNND
ncbi:MAG: YgjV family protein [Treponema sp.]|nr:YgjV family protein [Treponema sp.]